MNLIGGRAFYLARMSMFLMFTFCVLCLAVVFRFGDVPEGLVRVTFYLAGVLGTGITLLGGTNIAERLSGNFSAAPPNGGEDDANVG